MPWFIGQHSLGSHWVGFVADQPLIDPVPAVTGAEAVVVTAGSAGLWCAVCGHPDGAFPGPAAVAGYRTVAEGAALGAEEAPRFGLADGVGTRGVRKVRSRVPEVGVARRRETNGGRGDRRGQQGAGDAAAQESGSRDARGACRGVVNLVGVC